MKAQFNPKEFKNNNAAWEILDQTAAAGSDWTQGGCLILAEAFRIAFGYDVYAIFNVDKGIIDHFVAKTPSGYIDADGERKDIVKSFAKKENIADKLELRKFEEGMNAGEIPFDANASYKLALLLNPQKTSAMEHGKTESDVIREIEQKIKESCVASRYNNLCIRVQTEGGLAYVVNRCIAMMAKDKIHLSAALAALESEEEGIN